MADRQFDVALWLLPGSAWPEIAEERTADVWTLPHEVVLALMQERDETSVYKAVVNTGTFPPRVYWHLRLPGSTSMVTLPISSDDLVKQVWQAFEVDQFDPVEASSGDALCLVEAWASCDPDGLYARWCQLARAREVRALKDAWNERRAFEVRYRLLLELDREQSEASR